MADAGRYGRTARAALGRLVWFAQRATPRLERRYAQLASSAGLAAGADEQQQADLLRRYFGELRAALAELPVQPTFDVIVLAETADAWLAEAIASVRLQVYPHWRLLVVGGPSIPEFAVQDQRIVRVAAPATPPGGSAARWNAALAHTTGDYVLTLGPQDRLVPQALAELSRAVNVEHALTAQRPQILYSDERAVDVHGMPAGTPDFKPGWSPYLLLTGNYAGTGFAIDRLLVAELGGWHGAAEPDAGYDLLLRATEATHSASHVPQVLYQRRQVPQTPGRAHDAGTVVRAALQRRGVRATVAASSPGSCLVTPSFGQPPLVSVIIPTRDRGNLLRACVQSVLTRTDYPAFEITLVDNGSTEPEARRVLAELDGGERVSVLSRPGPFNFARLCNQGVATTRGSVLCLLNNDTEILTPEWLALLVGWAVQPDLGAIGAQLQYPNGTIQHAGLVGLGDAGPGHAFVARDPAAVTPLDLLQRTREVLAVTGACLVVEHAKFDAIGRLDEGLVPNDAGDVDLCLRLRERGWNTLYEPRAKLRHHESQTRGRSFRNFERQYLKRRWADQLLNDPYMNPNLRPDGQFTVDHRFPTADIPGALFARWIHDDSLGPEAPNGHQVNRATG